MAGRGRRNWQSVGFFFASLSLENRLYFIRRYWYADSIEAIAERFGVSESKVKVRLYRTREKLRLFLVKEGLVVK